MKDRALGGELVTYHECIKNGDVVTIVAVIEQGRHGPLLSLHAHGPNCKKSKAKEKA